VRLPNGSLEWTVEEEIPPQRLDHYLKRRLSRYSRTALQGFIQKGSVSRLEHSGNLLPLRAASRVHPGDVLQLRRPDPPPADPLSAPRIALHVLYEDEAMLVIDKPAGMLVHPAGVRIDNTVIGILRERYGDAQLDLAHRLDRETSGLLLLSRTAEAGRRLKAAFMHRQVAKTYLAVVRGQPAWDAECVDLPMGDSRSNVRVRQAVRPDGAVARTWFQKVRALGNGHALLQANPETGRLHQIRVHLEALGMPLVGDKIYGSEGEAFLQFRETGLTPELLLQLGHWRHALHAHGLSVPHPLSGVRMEFVAPLPQDLLELIERLDVC